MTHPPERDWYDTVAATETLVSRALDTPISILNHDVLWDFPGSRSSVLRCEAIIESQGGNRYIIVKRSKKDARLMSYEGNILEFLGEHEVTRCLVPTYIGCDGQVGLLVTEDVESTVSRLLGRILLMEDEHGHPDPTHADRASHLMVEFARDLGRLHCGTMGRKRELARRLRDVDAIPRTDHKIASIVRHLEDFGDVVGMLGLPVSAVLKSEIADALALLERPGPYEALVHGDATLGNVYVTENRLRFIDLETAGFRHMLLDGAFPVIRYVWSAWCRRLPDAVRDDMLKAYRDVIAPHDRAFRDDASFHDHLSAAAAAWLSGICSMIPEVLVTDRKWGRVTHRDRIMLGLEHFHDHTARADRLPALRQTASAMISRLRARWEGSWGNVPLYPAFRSLDPS